MRAAASALAAALLASPAAAQGPDLGTDAQRAKGKELYAKFCSQCHGDDGAGDGPAAPHLKPLPRDFTSGKFKIRTTPSGALPTTEDLKRIIARGMPYTSMPPWPRFSDEELLSLAYHLKTFSADFANPELAPKPVELPKAPKYSVESAAAGRKVYEETGCIACHGNLGRGDGPSAPAMKDDFGHGIRPADFTQRWTFRGGPTREDIFRTMTTGLNGTPMPAFGDALTPEQRWAITDYVYSLGGGDAPGYANLAIARALDEPIDLERGSALFEGAPEARFPVVGQIMEPGRAFHPAAVSVVVQAVHDGRDLALRVRWNDLRADTQGKNGPALAVPIEEEEGAPPEAAAAATDDPFGESADTGASAGPAEFSDAIAVQVPSQPPSGPRKPYFLFGDATSSVDLWFVDLARGSASTFTGKGSGAVEPSLAGDVTASAKYDEGEWSVVFRRGLRSAGGSTLSPGQFLPIAFSVWDGSARERGSRRGVTQWFDLYVEPARAGSAWGPMARAGLGVLAAEILIVFLVRRRRRTPAPAEPAVSPSARATH